MPWEEYDSVFRPLGRRLTSTSQGTWRENGAQVRFGHKSIISRTRGSSFGLEFSGRTWMEYLASVTGITLYYL